MNRALPLLIMIVGLGLAASFGARNGTDHVEFRRATWTADNASDDGAKRAAAATVAKGVPTPSTRVAQWFATGGFGWGLGVCLILGGAIMARRQQAADFAGGEDSPNALVDFPGTVRLLQAALPALAAQLEDLPEDDTAPAVRAELDRFRAEQFEPLVDGRGQLMARHGIATFAEYFGPFSSAERQLNRTWSALTDGYVPTAREALSDAQASLSHALDAWEKAERG